MVTFKTIFQCKSNAYELDLSTKLKVHISKNS